MRALSISWTLALLLTSGAGPRGGYLVIVNPDNPRTSVDRQFLEDAFLKKVTHWPEDGEIQPVDLAPTLPTRRQFSEDVLERSVEEVRTYWDQRIFSGRDVPPPQLDDDQQVVAYVASHPGAVGYVSSGTDLKQTKVVDVR
jgi:ABC-type phosphate transport system substrate-binding protein